MNHKDAIFLTLYSTKLHFGVNHLYKFCEYNNGKFLKIIPNLSNGSLIFLEYFNNRFIYGEKEIICEIWIENPSKLAEARLKKFLFDPEKVDKQFFITKFSC